MTKEELIIKRNELREILIKENKALETRFETFIQNQVGFDVRVSLTMHHWDKAIYMSVGIPYKEKLLTIDCYFEERHYWNRETNKREITKDSGMLQINYGTYGSHSKLDYDGKLKQLDILVGKLWELEDGLTNLYNEIDWTNEEKFYEVISQLDSIANEERRIERKKQEEEKQKLINDTLAKIKEGNKYSYSNDNYYKTQITKITPKCIYLSAMLHVNNRWVERINKEEFVELLMKNKIVEVED